jgi:protein-L-isoaspartate(D-aspartate) O-methyltransferase
LVLAVVGPHSNSLTLSAVSRRTRLRPAQPAPDGGKRFEVGVIGDGPAGRQLAEHVGRQITTWDAGFRTRRVRFALPDTPPPANPDAGRFVLPRPHHPITVTWE